MESESGSLSRPSTGRRHSSHTLSPLSNNTRSDNIVQDELMNDSLLKIMSEHDLKSTNDNLLSAETGNVAAIRQIISSGYNLAKCKGMDGFTCLHYAASRGHIVVVHELLQSQFPVNIKNDIQETALHLAVYNGNITTVEQLLDYGADVNSRNKYGETPLFYASRRTMPAIARLLLQRGADPLIEDNIGDKAIDQSENERMRQVFEESNKSPKCLNAGNKAGLIPNHLLKAIFEYLSLSDICKCAQVCCKWHRVSESEEIWANFGVRRWEYALQSTLGLSIAASDSFRKGLSTKTTLSKTEKNSSKIIKLASIPR